MQARGDEGDLAADEGQAHRGLLRRRGAIARRAPGHDVGDIDLGAVEADRREHPVEQLPGAADERAADPVFVAARRLAHQHDPRVGRAVGEHQLRRRRLEAAALEAFERRAQLVEGARRRGRFARRARGFVGRARRRRRGPGAFGPRRGGGAATGAGARRAAGAALSAKRSCGVSSSARSTPASLHQRKRLGARRRAVRGAVGFCRMAHGETDARWRSRLLACRRAVDEGGIDIRRRSGAIRA